MSAATCLLIEIDAPAFQEPWPNSLRPSPCFCSNCICGAFRHRIDEREHLAALQRVLIDGVGGFGRQLRRLRNHQHVDVRGDFLHVLINGANVEELADLAHDQPGLRRLIAHRRLAAIERQRCHQANGAFLRICQRVDQLRHIVFEERFTIGREEGNCLLIVGCVRCDEAEIADLAFGVQPQALQPCRDRLVLGIGEGLGIEYRKLQLAAGDIAILLEEGSDAIEVARNVGRGCGEVAERNRAGR